MYKESDLAYLAGIIDGEGSIIIGNSGYYCLLVVISNTHLGMMEHISNLFGGHVYKCKTHSIGKKPIYRLHWSGTSAYNILMLVQPYLIIKSEQAKLGIDFQGLVNTGPVTKQDLNTRSLYKLAISNLNHK